MPENKSKKLTKAQQALYEAMLKRPDGWIYFTRFTRGSRTTTFNGYPGRVTEEMVRAMVKKGVLKSVLVKPGEKNPDGSEYHLLVSKVVYVVVPPDAKK